MIQSPLSKLTTKIKIDSDMDISACDFLAKETGLSKTRIKDAMNKGAFWIKKKRGGLKRFRRASAHLRAGDISEFCYDERLLALSPPEAKCLSDQGHYSIWHKPAGLMSQGTMYGDHCAVLRQAELFFRNLRPVFLVHRLDREASGLMIVAHSRESASRFSELFRKNLIIKQYRAEVLGNLLSKKQHGTIVFPLDRKPAFTEYTVESYSPGNNTSLVNIIIKTGRLHQIRRHFDMIGFPVIGDPKYGKGNKNSEGMRLTASVLRFACPFSNRDVEFKLPEEYLLTS